MLSILIPVFNYDCSDLILALADQASELKMPFEILVYDDCSTQEQALRPSVLSIAQVKYRKMNANLGRSKIRNLLAQEALYNNLLFLDCDSLPADKNFIKHYLTAIETADCVCGGTVYPPRNAISEGQILHWTYGTKREMKAGRKSDSVFMANNFLIRKEIFLNIGFDASIVGYGHEDTLFGIMLSQFGYRITQIDNPVVHLGLHDTSSFLANTKNAAVNLRLLYDNQQYRQSLSTIKLVKTFKILRKLRLDFALRAIRRPLMPILARQLGSSKPSMLVLDIYKLLCFAQKSV